MRNHTSQSTKTALIVLLILAVVVPVVLTVLGAVAVVAFGIYFASHSGGASRPAAKDEVTIQNVSRDGTTFAVTVTPGPGYAPGGGAKYLLVVEDEETEGINGPMIPNKAVRKEPLVLKQGTSTTVVYTPEGDLSPEGPYKVWITKRAGSSEGAASGEVAVP